MKIVLGAHIDEAVENSKKVGLYADDVRETDTSNLFLFHEKPLEQGDFEFDEHGNLLIRPMGDWQVTDEGLAHFNSSTSSVDSGVGPYVKGDPEAKFYRRTIHFGINGPVAGVENMGGLAGGRVVKAANAAMFRLDDAVQANPGSLDNLLSHDTFMTPAPGKPLMIPKGKFKIMSRVEGGDWTADGVGTTVEDVAVSLGADREKFAGQQFTRRGDLNEKVKGTSMGLKRVAHGKYGVSSVEHDGSPQSALDMIKYETVFGNDYENIRSASQIARVSQNTTTSYYDLGLPTGATKGVIETNIDKELADKLGIIVTRARTI
jgi:hypothetical protein